VSPLTDDSTMFSLEIATDIFQALFADAKTQRMPKPKGFDIARFLYIAVVLLLYIVNKIN
jgi:hypothetical protein